MLNHVLKAVPTLGGILVVILLCALMLDMFIKVSAKITMLEQKRCFLVGYALRETPTAMVNHCMLPYQD
jgi:hypothetical protein